MQEPQFPDLSGAKVISLDCETRDPNLLKVGPGGVRGDGEVVGVSLAVGGWSTYYPIGHKAGGNIDKKKVVSYLKEQLKSNIPKIGANILYDLEWLRTLGIKVGGPKLDIQHAEALLDEDRETYRLDALAVDYLGRHKEEKLMEEWGKKLKIKPEDLKHELWRLPGEAVYEYGRVDSVLPLEIWPIQKKALEEQELTKVFELETRMIDLLLEMRFKGCPVDLKKAERVAKQLEKEEKICLRRVKDLIGFIPEIWAAESIHKVCKKVGVPSERTPKGNYSFLASWFESQEHPVFPLILKARQLNRAGSVFIRQKILEIQVNGRIHPQFFPVKRDRGGTRSGRLSSQNPNAQQIPARDKVIGPLIRSIFLPEEGCQWGTFDYSQQEPRVTVHYALLCGFRGAAEAAERYRKDPSTDYHQMVADMASIPRKIAKTINLGLSYGMGKKKLAEQLGVSFEESVRISDQYHRNVPFIKALGDYCQRIANQRGFVKTLLGRRRRFQLFGPAKWEQGMKPMKKEEAIKKYGPIVKRYFCHKALNAIIQGGSADMVKKALLDGYDAGYIPHLTVHDENDYSIENKKQVVEIKDIMMNAIKLEVPLKVDVELGKSWGEAIEQ